MSLFGFIYFKPSLLLICQALIEDSRDILMDWLDTQHGSSVTDNAIFADLPRHYEAEYHEDMAALNVSIPAQNFCGEEVTWVCYLVLPSVLQYQRDNL